MGEARSVGASRSRWNAEAKVRAFGIGAFLLSTFSVFWTSMAYAQEPSAQPPATAPSQPLDVVLLKNGGMLRGTISELVPNEYVIIDTTSGKQRRIDMAEVKYAGPAKDAPSAEAPAKSDAPSPPPAPAPAPTPQAPEESSEVDVQFNGDPGVRFHIRTGQAVLMNTRLAADSFSEVCTVPCSTKLQRQSYTFGLSDGDGRPVLAENAVQVDRPLALNGKFQSYAGLRVAGWIVVIGGALAGTALIMSSSNDCDALDDTCEPIDSGMLWGGVAVGLGGAVIGVVMAMKKDESDVQVASALQASRRSAIAAPRRAGGGRSRFVVPILSGSF
jgi:hypothetical protein